MRIDTIKWGETYEINATVSDANGDAITLDGTWSAVCVVTKGGVGNKVFFEPAVSIVGGAVVGEIDTGAEIWAAGTYYYDVRVTDSDGNDIWSDPVQLELETRNSPPSS